MEEEKDYMVWTVNASWIENGKQDEEFPERYIGIDKGRIPNGTGFTKAFKEDVTEEEVVKIANEWWHNFSTSDKQLPLCPTLVKLEVTYKGRQTWWLEWFNHCTFNTFKNEQEAFKSFQAFLDKKGVEMNYGHGLTSTSRFNKDGYCAMGADDRYRWELCDCESCMANGVTRIKH